jgi:hypothetical protein
MYVISIAHDGGSVCRATSRRDYLNFFLDQPKLSLATGLRFSARAQRLPKFMLMPELAP